MSEYIVELPMSGAADEFIAKHGVDDCRLYGYKLTGEIVRCRDCAYMFDWAYGRPLCKLWAFNDQDESESSHGNALYPEVELDGYCAWGERKEGGE